MRPKPGGCVAVASDVAAWCFMLGAAALLGVVLERIAHELAPRLTAAIAEAGALGSLVRWALVRTRQGRGRARSVSYDTYSKGSEP